MTDLKIMHAAIDFVRADIEYVRLLQSMLDVWSSGERQFSPEEISGLEAAQARKAALEEQMYRIWQTSGV